MAVLPSRILAVDVGERRIGLAVADSSNRLPKPYKTLANNESILQTISQVIKDESIDILVIGLPRSLDGEDTAQTRYVRTFADSLKAVTEAKLYFEDEALSSVRAEQLMQAKHRPIVKADIDSLAASYILDDFLFSHRELFNG